MDGAAPRRLSRTMTTRPETAADVPRIAAIVDRAFAGHPHSHGTEAAIVRELRAAGALSVSLVAEIDGQVWGHVAASPVRIDGVAAPWFGLGPVAVEPACQRRGLGSRLITDCLAALRSRSAAGCVVFGSPAYYARFGFAPIEGLVVPGLPAEFFMAQSFDGSRPTGAVRYHPAFDTGA